MAMTNTQEQRPRFSVAISTPGYQKLINNTIRDPRRAASFISSITSAVAVNPALQECDAPTVLAGALLGESLGLSPSPQLGHYYLVPYWNKKKGCNDAVFTMGYRGMVQLAIRSGDYKKINALAIKQGELINWNPLTEELEIRLIEDDTEREKAPTIGYFAFFECINGYTKKLYWSKEKMLAHADRYSQAFHLNAVIDSNPKKSRVSFADYEAGNYPKDDEWKYSSFWYKDFDAMAFKTMLRQLISKWGPMSIEFQKSVEDDGAVMRIRELLIAEDVTDFPEARFILRDNEAKAVDEVLSLYLVSEKLMEMGMPNQFPARLRKLRERRHLSRKTLGELCGLSKNMIGMYESGEKEPSVGTLIALADYFEIPVDYLIGRQNFL